MERGSFNVCSRPDDDLRVIQVENGHRAAVADRRFASESAGSSRVLRPTRANHVFRPRHKSSPARFAEERMTF